MNFFQLTAVCACVIAASTTMASPAPAGGERGLSATAETTLLGREAETGDDRRGRGGRGRGGAKAIEQDRATTIAREAETGDDRRGRGGRGRGGVKAIEEVPALLIAREDERRDDHGDDGEETELDDHA